MGSSLWIQVAIENILLPIFLTMQKHLLPWESSYFDLLILALWKVNLVAHTL